MPANILMPALSPTMEKGNLAKWLKKEGDKVSSGDVLAEIETDKATMEVEAVDEGILAKIVVPEGTADVPVNELIAVIASDGEDPKEVAAGAGKGGAAAAPAKSEAPQTEQPAKAPAAAEAKPAEARPAEAKSAEAKSAEAKSDAAVTSAPQPVAKPAGEGGRVFASPLAKRLARDGGIDIAAIAGSGPHGRVVERDVKAALAGGAAKPAPAAAAPAAQAPKTAATPLAAGMADEQVKKLFEPGSFEEIPHDSMRKTIARRLTESKQTIPHFYLSVDCELDALLALREQINAAAPKDGEGKPAYKVSVNDFVIKALAVSLIRVPDANVSWTDSAMLRHKHADVGVAVAIPGGLITPVVRKAETKTLSTISNEMKDYAARARTRKLKPEEYQGGSTAVSNLGMFGIKDFSAVINPPHATILAVGAGEKRVVVKNNAPAIATVMTVTLSTDHRAVDGALGAELISAFKQLIENPMGMLV
ncbi:MULTISPECIES: pyruvate dehydrogenase complex dihydrolipoamide acetyltransferase [unclassified Chelatococcus]|uniref:pyruvate dehydrogenase complex dihydrolipoamide acetyltransferase n=1 Tax=unclassified Chelatococcus TaxID=2638111 RepID=UPI001BCDA9AC|nr:MULTISPECIES: pyruvate dehydrogenase complex dihydrolipoamide acetyltransferase [unclassified Chelatococcus]MBS7699344.1 pyruvate dehydrogenase complex dihydrolipoamide acetyltransferase [Chelatococcus sp. YT9]MBX3557524.1 pyruvate dehydrogenase complex dihydrolipoamide acetyltransferase [Chelatococcus sp.]